MKKTLILILCLFLCTVSFARKRVKVACVGNSITYGIGVSDPDKESYPARLYGGAFWKAGSYVAEQGTPAFYATERV